MDNLTLIDRLRAESEDVIENSAPHDEVGGNPGLYGEAADEIERLEDRWNDAMKLALVIEGRAIAQGVMQRPGISADRLRDYIGRVDALING